MAKRKRIALIYAYNENWIGGTYYIENLIAALGKLPDSQQPELLICSLEIADAERLQKSISYPYWSFHQFGRPQSLLVRAVNKLADTLIKRRIINELPNGIDIVFPLPTAWRYSFSHIPHHLYWIPDFQEHYLPAFFKADELQGRKNDQKLVLSLARHIVFSSHAAQNDFNEIYPDNKVNQYVLQFAVSNQIGSEQAINYLDKYAIKQPFFICSNQFWKHKNHAVVLQALVEVRRAYPEALVVFTGKEHDYRNPDYFEGLSALTKEYGLHDSVKFLGFIPRKDQLMLMQSSVAVIQPSLFEGWSTVVEDAKSLNAPLIASDLSVHKEQLAEYGPKMYFASQSNKELAQCMQQALAGHLVRQPYNYEHRVIKFAKNFLDIVYQISQ